MRNSLSALKAVFFFLTAVLTAMTAEAQVDFQEISSLGGIEVKDAREFTALSLYGYIDGGAELYMEYGFEKLSVFDVTDSVAEVRVEIYRMKDSYAAFGIFSVSRFRCNGGPKLTRHLCRSAYQLQFCKGPFYVSIINDGGTDEEHTLSDNVTRWLLAHMEGEPFEVFDFIPAGISEEKMKSAVLVRGPLGIYNGIPSASELLNEASGYSALITEEDSVSVASVIFKNDSLAGAFLNTRGVVNMTDSIVNVNGSVIKLHSPTRFEIVFR